MSVLPSVYPEQKPIYLRSGDPIELPEHSNYVNLREFLRHKTVAIHTQEALQLVGVRNRDIRVRSISEFPYNCVGMVLGNRRAWIDLDSEEIESSLSKDGYRRISQDAVEVGDVVLYENQDGFSHIGTIIYVKHEGIADIRVLSKWGFAGEIIHHLLDVPTAYGLASQYWTERVSSGPK